MKKTIQAQFEDLLEENEKIQKIIRPNKTRSFLLALGISFVFSALFSIVGMIELINHFEETYILVPILQCIIIMAIYLAFWALYTHNHFYAITDKRIIKRRGFFGVDYVSVNIEDVHDMFVKKLMLDKILKNDTGTILISHMSNAVEDDTEPSGDIFRLSGVEESNKIFDLIKEMGQKEEKQDKSQDQQPKQDQKNNKKKK